MIARRLLIIPIVLLLLFSMTTLHAQKIRSGKTELAVIGSNGSYGIRIAVSGNENYYQQLKPLAVEVVDEKGIAQWVEKPYSSRRIIKGKIELTGIVDSKNGSVFRFTDTYIAYDAKQTFVVSREVQVLKASGGDKGFSTRLAFQTAKKTGMANYDFMVPSGWYKDNKNVAAYALASHPGDNDYWFREDRLPLPIFMLREKSNGLTFSVFHKDADGSTFKEERGTERIIDGRMKFAAVGMQNKTQPLVGLVFPGTEGERTGVSGMRDQQRWAYRSNPVAVGYKQKYSMALRLTMEVNYDTALQHTWNTYYDIQNPGVYAVDLDKVYNQQIGILDKYWRRINGSAGVPFRIKLNGLAIDADYNWNMGFVGQQIPNAALLIREGLASGNQSLLNKGEEMVEFWCTQAMAPTGIPKTWYDPYPQRWRQIPTHIRTLGDGMNGLLMAWKFEKNKGIDKPSWLNTAKRVADWLLSVQNKDGSFYQQYDFNNGVILNNTKNNTTNIIPFLVDLYKITGADEYKLAAKQAGEFAFADVYQNFKYAGGAADNPNVPDKEAISMALRSFLALHDLETDEKWLKAAKQAAHYYQTWVYSWPVPLPEDPNAVFPLTRNVTGLSPIATGNNGSDTYAAIDAFNIYRMYLYTDDESLLKFTKLLLNNTKQYVNWNPNEPINGFAPGFLGEVMNVTIPRAHGVDYYLPWQTYNLLEPMVLLKDTFGSYKYELLNKIPSAKKKAANNEYSRSRGF